jgi:hypothetical protein
MEVAAHKPNRFVMSARILLGGILLSSLIACSSGDGDSPPPDLSNSSGTSGSSSSSSSSSSSTTSTTGSTSSTSSSSSSSSGDASSSSSSSSSSGGGDVAVVDVVWTELINVSVDGDTLEKTGGCDGCLDAGAESAQFMPAANGYVEFPVMNTSLIRYIGLNPNSTTARPTEITFALKIVSGTAEVKEEGQYRADTPVSVGDVMRIEVRSGVVTYAKNGNVFYTSTVTMSLPLQVDTALISLGGTFTDVRMTVAASSSAVAASLHKSNADNVVWTELMNVTANGNTLQKTGGCDGCADAGAVSQQSISGDANLDFTVAETGPELYIGLNNASTGTGIAEIPYAFKLINDRVEVREHGQYRAGIAVGSGDALRIRVRSGVVSYAKNGGVFYTSSTAASYPLQVDTSLVSSGATLSNARLGRVAE